MMTTSNTYERLLRRVSDSVEREEVQCKRARKREEAEKSPKTAGSWMNRLKGIG